MNQDQTTIKYELTASSEVSFKISNILGQEILTLVDGHRDKGSHSVVFSLSDTDRTGPGSGIFFAALTAGNQRKIIRLVIAR